MYTSRVEVSVEPVELVDRYTKCRAGGTGRLLDCGAVRLWSTVELLDTWTGHLCQGQPNTWNSNATEQILQDLYTHQLQV